MNSWKKVLLLGVAGVFAVTLVGCGKSASTESDSGGSGSATVEESTDTRTDYVWFKVDVPDGYVLDTSTGKDCSVARFSSVEESEEGHTINIIPVFHSHTTVEDQVNKEVEFWAESAPRTVNEPVTIGKYTWTPLEFECNSASVDFYTEVEGNTIEVSFHDAGIDEPVVQEFLESIEFPDDINTAYNKAGTIEAPEA